MSHMTLQAASHVVVMRERGCLDYTVYLVGLQLGNAVTYTARRCPSPCVTGDAYASERSTHAVRAGARCYCTCVKRAAGS